MLTLRAFLTARLMSAAEEIFEVVERTIAEYKEEIIRSKDLEISRLRMQIKLLKTESMGRCIEAQLEDHTHHQHHHQSPPPPPQLHQSSPAEEASVSQHPVEEEEGSSMDQEHPEPSQVKKEARGSPRDFWIGQEEAAEHLDNLDIKDFMSTSSDPRNHLHDPILPFHPHFHLINGGSSGEEGREKPYCCNVCEKRFSNCSHLAAHIRTHTGERPYVCEICRKTFVTTSALNRHQTIHTEGKHFICNYCGKSFKWMESLGRHIRSVHKKDGVPSFLQSSKEGVPSFLQSSNLH